MLTGEADLRREAPEPTPCPLRLITHSFVSSWIHFVSELIEIKGPDLSLYAQRQLVAHPAVAS